MTCDKRDEITSERSKISKDDMKEKRTKSIRSTRSNFRSSKEMANAPWKEWRRK
jgi:hypothetical protein